MCNYYSLQKRVSMFALCTGLHDLYRCHPMPLPLPLAISYNVARDLSYVHTNDACPGSLRLQV